MNSCTFCFDWRFIWFRFWSQIRKEDNRRTNKTKQESQRYVLSHCDSGDDVVKNLFFQLFLSALLHVTVQLISKSAQISQRQIPVHPLCWCWKYQCKLWSSLNTDTYSCTVTMLGNRDGLDWMILMRKWWLIVILSTSCYNASEHVSKNETYSCRFTGIRDDPEDDVV